MVYLPGTDRISHALWGCIEKPGLYPPVLRPSLRERRAGVRALFDYYAYVDGLVGRLVKRFTAKDLVMVVSDHGFEAGSTRLPRTTGRHETPKAQNGIVFVRGPGIPEQGKPLGLTVRDITPTILAWAGIPIGRDMEGHVARFLEGIEPRSIPTWKDLPIERLRSGPSGAEPEIMRELRGIGYIE